MSLQAKINAKVQAKVEAMIEAAIEKALNGGDEAPVMPSTSKSVSVSPKSDNAHVQDLMDVARRALRYGKTNKVLSKAERKLAKSVMKGVKTAFAVKAGQNDCWKAAGL